MSELRINALHGLVHVNIAKGDTVVIRAANGANDKANARGVDVVKLHVGGSVLDSDGIVLAPDVAEVNVHIAAGHIKAVGVEGRHVFQGVLFLACESPSINIKYVDQSGSTIFSISTFTPLYTTNTRGCFMTHTNITTSEMQRKQMHYSL